MPKIILVRTDKIGDLISTLPVDESPLLKSYQVSWLINESLDFIAKASIPPRNCLGINPKHRFKSFLLVYRFAKQEGFEKSCFFYGPWWLAMALWLAGIPERGGRLSQWFSFLFFNRGLRQKRSLGLTHEADDNQDLLQHLFSEALGKKAAVLQLQSARMNHLFEKWALGPQTYFVVHPGMAGSALNWSQESYISLIHELIKTHPVAITGTAGDGPWLNKIATEFKTHPRVRWMQSHLDSQELLFILKNARTVIGPSTGVLHLAASLGSKVIGLYSPVKAQHPRRWGPRGDHVHILIPTVNCPASRSCLKQNCKHYNCLDSILPKQIESLL